MEFRWTSMNFDVKNLDNKIQISMLILYQFIQLTKMVYTTSLEHYKKLLAKWITAKLVTKADIQIIAQNLKK